jgi:hypothetical protein
MMQTYALVTCQTDRPLSKAATLTRLLHHVYITAGQDQALTEERAQTCAMAVNDTNQASRYGCGPLELQATWSCRQGPN